MINRYAMAGSNRCVVCVCVCCVCVCVLLFFLMIRRPPRSTLDRSSAASDVYKRQAPRDRQSQLAPTGAELAAPNVRVFRFLDSVAPCLGAM